MLHSVKYWKSNKNDWKSRCKTSRNFKSFKSWEKLRTKNQSKEFFREKKRNTEIKNEIDEIKKWKEKAKRKYLKYEAKYYIYDFQEYKTIKCFSGNCYTCKINVDKAGIDQSDSWKN